MAILACVGTAGNLLIIGSVCIERRLRVRGNAFIVNLALADLLVTAYIMPVGIATSQYHLKPFSDTLCDFNAFAFITTCGVSTQTLMLIAFERYMHVCKLEHYGRVYKPKLIALYIFIAWLYTMIWAAQGWTGWSEYMYGHDYYLCLFYGPASMSYSICLSIFGVILPIIVLIYCYVNIFRTVKRSKLALETHGSSTPSFELKMRKKQLREHQFIFMLFIIVSVFCVCWAPGACVMALSGVLGEDGLPVLAYTITIWIAICNSAMNSAIYGIMNNNFRRGYAHIVKRIFCCCCRTGDGGAQCSSSGDAKSARSGLKNDDTNKSYLSNGKATDTATEFSTLPMSQGGFSAKRTKSDLTAQSETSSKTPLAPPVNKVVIPLRISDASTVSIEQDKTNDKEKLVASKHRSNRSRQVKIKETGSQKERARRNKDTNNNNPRMDNRSDTHDKNPSYEMEPHFKHSATPSEGNTRYVKTNWDNDNDISRSRDKLITNIHIDVKRPVAPRASDLRHTSDIVNDKQSNHKGNWEKSRARDASQGHGLESRSRSRTKSSRNNNDHAISSRSKSASNIKSSSRSSGSTRTEQQRSRSSEGQHSRSNTSSQGQKSRSRSHSKHKCQHKNHIAKHCSHNKRSQSKSSERRLESSSEQNVESSSKQRMESRSGSSTPVPMTRNAHVQVEPNKNIVTLTLTANV